jgi:ABC-type nitrate/sulfonate/bicarbonate transport system substrate-binding protein
MVSLPKHQSLSLYSRGLIVYGLWRMVRMFELYGIGYQPYAKYLVLLIAFAVAWVQASAAAPLERVRVGYSVGGLIPFPVVIARENKLFEPLGLEIELINIPPTLAVTALVSGDLQYVIFAGTTLNAAVRGLPVVNRFCPGVF